MHALPVVLFIPLSKLSKTKCIHPMTRLVTRTKESSCMVSIWVCQALIRSESNFPLI